MIIVLSRKGHVVTCSCVVATVVSRLCSYLIEEFSKCGPGTLQGCVRGPVENLRKKH